MYTVHTYSRLVKCTTLHPNDSSDGGDVQGGNEKPLQAEVMSWRTLYIRLCNIHTVPYLMSRRSESHEKRPLLSCYWQITLKWLSEAVTVGSKWEHFGWESNEHKLPNQSQIKSKRIKHSCWVSIVAVVGPVPKLGSGVFSCAKSFHCRAAFSTLSSYSAETLWLCLFRPVALNTSTTEVSPAFFFNLLHTILKVSTRRFVVEVWAYLFGVHVT